MFQTIIICADMFTQNDFFWLQCYAIAILKYVCDKDMSSVGIANLL